MEEQMIPTSIYTHITLHLSGYKKSTAGHTRASFKMHSHFVPPPTTNYVDHVTPWLLWPSKFHLRLRTKMSLCYTQH